MAQSVSTLIRELDLPFLLIGGHSLAFYGYPRNTLDIDFLISDQDAESWCSTLRKRGYIQINAQGPFAQFSKSGDMPIDLMIVDHSTWEKLRGNAHAFSFDEIELMIPAPEHIVALKLHSAVSPHRRKAEQDWEDIRHLVQLQDLNPENDSFKELILRYGGESSLEKVVEFYHGD